MSPCLPNLFCLTFLLLLKHFPTDGFTVPSFFTPHLILFFHSYISNALISLIIPKRCPLRLILISWCTKVTVGTAFSCLLDHFWIFMPFKNTSFSQGFVLVSLTDHFKIFVADLWDLMTQYCSVVRCILTLNANTIRCVIGNSQNRNRHNAIRGNRFSCVCENESVSCTRRVLKILSRNVYSIQNDELLSEVQFWFSTDLSMD